MMESLAHYLETRDQIHYYILYKEWNFFINISLYYEVSDI